VAVANDFEVQPDGKLKSFVPLGRVREVSSFKKDVVLCVAFRAAQLTPIRFNLLSEAKAAVT